MIFFNEDITEYFRITELAERKKLYKLISSRAADKESATSAKYTETDLAALTVIKKLYEQRYVDPKHPEAEVDVFLWYIMALLQHFQNGGLFKNRRKKEILKLLSLMGIEDGMTTDEPEGCAAYMECRNAVRKYFECCSDSKYGGKLLGLIPSTEDDRSARMRLDAYSFSYGLAEKFGIEREMQLFLRAVDDEYMDFTHTVMSLKA